MILSVKTVVGSEVCMTREDGQKLHDAYRPLLNAGEVVSLDFSGTRVFVSAFFNAAVGQLLRDFPKAELGQKLLFKNLPPAAVAPLNKSIETADRYFRDAGYREALDSVLKEQSELV